MTGSDTVVARAGGARLPGCQVKLISTPDGATVLVGGRATGITPVELVLPCERTTIALKRPRYEPLQKVIVPTPERRLELRLALQRPEHAIRIISTPSGAAVSINGRAAGTTPLNATVAGFITATIELRKPGFRAQRTRVYMRRPGQVVALRLAR